MYKFRIFKYFFLHFLSLKMDVAVETLGGEVNKQGIYDASATHMIAGKVLLQPGLSLTI